MTQSKTILVTGGAGYIGVPMVKLLLTQGYAVRVFDKLYFDDLPLRESVNGKGSASPFAENKLTILQGDVRNFDDRVLEDVHAVIHLGSLSNDPTAEFDPKANHEINCVGTVNVAEACIRKGIKRFTFASTCAVTGFHVEGIADEAAPTNPQSEYAQSKLVAEKELLKLSGKNGFCPVLFRQATVFGFSPRMRWDLVVNTMTKDAYEKGRIYVYNAGEMWRPLVHVQDVAKAHLAAIEAPEEKVKGEIFNLVHKNYRILELAHWIKDVLRDLKTLSVEVLFGTKEVRSYRASGEKLKNTLGFEPALTVKEAVLEIYTLLQNGKYTDFANPIYYNIDWMKLLTEMENRLQRIGKIF